MEMPVVKTIWLASFFLLANLSAGHGGHVAENYEQVLQERGRHLSPRHKAILQNQVDRSESIKSLDYTYSVWNVQFIEPGFLEEQVNSPEKAGDSLVWKIELNSKVRVVVKSESFYLEDRIVEATGFLDDGTTKSMMHRYSSFNYYYVSGSDPGVLTRAVPSGLQPGHVTVRTTNTLVIGRLPESVLRALPDSVALRLGLTQLEDVELLANDPDTRETSIGLKQNVVRREFDIRRGSYTARIIKEYSATDNRIRFQSADEVTSAGVLRPVIVEEFEWAEQDLLPSRRTVKRGDPKNPATVLPHVLAELAPGARVNDASIEMPPIQIGAGVHDYISTKDGPLLWNSKHYPTDIPSFDNVRYEEELRRLLGK